MAVIKQQTNIKKLRGTVVSNKMDKTVVVRVDRLVAHPIYKKRRTVSKKYLVHYEEGELNEGDKVIIGETRPMSKRKRWQVISP